jgi:lipoprotein NlpD
MILSNSIIRFLALVIILIFLSGCRASGNRRAPIEERGEAKASSVEERDSNERKSPVSNKKITLDSGSKVYVVQKGDTLYSIAFEHGLDYREVAEQNNIDNPAAIQIGQQIKLLSTEDGVREKPQVDSKPVSASSIAIETKDYPKIFKMPYSEEAVVQIAKMQQGTGHAETSVVPSKPQAKPTPTQEVDSGSEEGIAWGMPTKGKLIGDYSETANRKGVDISGSKGQVVVASAAGKVVYSGSGLRGYGKLVIIKHNKTYLSAYAHNDQILVKEGQNVSKGQKIAEMGSSDSDQVKLHFEIRKFGKPVDPAKFLNFTKS